LEEKKTSKVTIFFLIINSRLIHKENFPSTKGDKGTW
jgi:hypothetical protein